MRFNWYAIDIKIDELSDNDMRFNWYTIDMKIDELSDNDMRFNWYAIDIKLMSYQTMICNLIGMQ